MPAIPGSSANQWIPRARLLLGQDRWATKNSTHSLATQQHPQLAASTTAFGPRQLLKDKELDCLRSSQRRTAWTSCLNKECVWSWLLLGVTAVSVVPFQGGPVCKCSVSMFQGLLLKLRGTRASLLGARSYERGARGLTTRSKKLLVTKGSTP